MRESEPAGGAGCAGCAVDRSPPAKGGRPRPLDPAASGVTALAGIGPGRAALSKAMRFRGPSSAPFPLLPRAFVNSPKYIHLHVHALT